MPSVFPSLSAFGGVKGICKSGGDDSHTDKTLADLNKDSARMVDTFIYDYPNLVRDSPEPFARVTGEAQTNTKVAIIGGGFAGATAAYELKRAGIKPENITVYEARRKNGSTDAQFGGRAYSLEFDDGSRKYVNEMGPMRVPSNSKLFWHYFSTILSTILGEGAQNVIQKVFPNPGVVATQLIFRGLKYNWKGNETPTLEPGQNEEGVDWGKLQDDIEEFIGTLNFGGQTVVTIGDLLQEEELTAPKKAQIIQYWQHFLLEYNDVPFIKALEDYFGERWGETEYSMFSTLGLGTGGFGPLFPVCFQEIMRLLIWEYEDEYIPCRTNEEETPDEGRIKPAMMPIAEIVEELFNLEVPSNPGPIEILNETVDYIGITNDSQNVKVYSINASNRIETRTYDYVIVAAPLRSMQIRMNLDAKAPSRLEYQEESNAVFAGDEDYKIRESLRIPHIMNSSKLFGLVSPKPWAPGGIESWPKYNDDEPIKCVLTDTLARQMYFLDQYPNNDAAGSNALISYNWGDDSVKIMAIRNYESWQVIDQGANPDFVLKNAYKFGLEGSDPGNSPIAAALDSIQIADQEGYLDSIVWQEEPMIYGAFKLDYPNQFYATSQLVYQYQQAVNESNQAGKRVYLAGNNCTFQGGWVEGAMQSGVNASAAVLKHMELTYTRDVVQDFRMDDLFQPNPFQEVLDDLENNESQGNILSRLLNFMGF